MTICVTIRFAVKCGDQFFALSSNEIKGEAVVAGCELANYLGCNIESAFMYMQTAPLKIDAPENMMTGEVMAYLLKACVQDPPDSKSFPGELYVASSYINFFIDDLDMTMAKLADVIGSNRINLYALINGNAGEVYRGKVPGVTFRFHSKEQCSHSRPHVHVKHEHDYEASISIQDGAILAGEEAFYKIPGKIRKGILRLIESNRSELLKKWLEQTDGIRIDLDAALGQTDCSGL